MSPLKIGALFAGYGGLDLAVSSVLDAEPVWFSEFDKGPSKILEHRFPGVPNHGDITKIDWSQVEPVDILTGGSPCQDLSHAGRRAGMTEGTRSNLWVAMREAIAQLRPSLVVWENVRGAYSAEAASSGTVVTKRRGSRTDRSVVYEGGLLAHADGGPTLRALGRVLGDLSDLGYDAVWHGVRAADIGAPHGRFRVFLVAHPRGVGRVGGPSLVGDWRQTAQRGEARRDAGNSGAPPALTLLPTPAVNDMGASYTPEEWDAWTDRMKAEHGNGNGHGKSLHVEAARLIPTPTVRDWRDGGDTGANVEAKAYLGREVWNREAWGQYAEAIARWENLTRTAPEPTELNKLGNRRLSPRFSEWMMGLPAGWVTDVPGITRNEALKALGNGVVPQQAAAALRVLLGASEVAA